jgi:hypothetical protein
MGKPDPEDPISPVDPGAFHRALEYGYLLAQGEVLRGERGAALEHEPEKDGDDLQHAHRGSRVREMPRAYRVALSRPEIEKHKQWQDVPNI